MRAPAAALRPWAVPGGVPGAHGVHLCLLNLCGQIPALAAWTPPPGVLAPAVWEQALGYLCNRTKAAARGSLYSGSVPGVGSLVQGASLCGALD